jgi:hypothetical protein
VNRKNEAKIESENRLNNLSITMKSLQFVYPKSTSNPYPGTWTDEELCTHYTKFDLKWVVKIHSGPQFRHWASDIRHQTLLK